MKKVYNIIKCFIWKIRYTIYMKKKADMPLLMGWHFAEASLEDYMYDTSYHPHFVAEQEMSFWR